MRISHKKKSRFIFLYIIMGIEVFLTGIFFIRGPQGLRVLQALKHEQAALQKSIITITSEIKQLKASITRWNATPFYREQLAREQLQMAYADDIVYYITDKK